MPGIVAVRHPLAIRAPRVLIATSDIGAGHDLPAELLRDALLASWDPAPVVMVADVVRNSGPLVRAVVRSGSETVLRQAPWLYDVQYALISGFAPAAALNGRILARLAQPRLLGLIAETRPDVIVSTYPGSTEVLGVLRGRGRVTVPVVAAITDLAALRYWANPAVDRHLITHAESRAEVLRIAGAGADVVHVRGFSRPAFDHPPERAEARAALGLPPDGPVVVVSGGGWGVGDLERATGVVLAVPGATAVCLCGTNAELRARLDARFAGSPRVRTEGFTERIADWLAAADVLVHATAGLTVLEAQLCGTWAISYGWGVGHLRRNNRAYERFGLAAVANTEDELAQALRSALAAPRQRYEGYAELPTAAAAIGEVIGATPSRAR